MASKLPVINCHTHIFKGDAVPPLLAKSFFPWPGYYLLNTSFILGLTRFWYNNRKWSPRFWPYGFLYRRIQKALYAYKSFVRRYTLMNIVVLTVNYLLIIHAAYYLFRPALKKLIRLVPIFLEWAVDLKQQLLEWHLFYPNPSWWIKGLIIAFVFIGIRSGRQMLLGIVKYGTKLGGIFPDNKTIQFYKRYINLGRFANYDSSSGILGRLEKQYDPDTGFVILPMDMAFMGAGKLRAKGHFYHQMEELAKIKAVKKETAFPFVFIDPRRIDAEVDFLKYKANPSTGEVILENCFLQKYIEDYQFNGFKIYPALGYYPFDERLLILWKYAADHQLPIMTHAIRGTIFYRGTKKKEWGYHPVFQQSKGNQHKEPEPLLLPELRNVDFINNFTHPLNYLALVDERVLRHLLATCNKEVQKFFGFKDKDTALKHNLSQLKICFGHYGGDDEWNRYLEYDRNQYAPQLTSHPDTGLDFFSNGQFSGVKMEQLWKNADWYTIISSLMLQYDNLYADISYIIHNPEIIPLLKTSLKNPELKKRILFGTDFYVVRNHKSEREMFGELQANLSEEEFDQIARYNPRFYLESMNYKNPLRTASLVIDPSALNPDIKAEGSLQQT